MRTIVLDIQRTFAEAVILEDGTVRRLGRVDMTRESLQAFAARLLPTDHVSVEAAGNAALSSISLGQRWRGLPWPIPCRCT